MTALRLALALLGVAATGCAIEYVVPSGVDTEDGTDTDDLIGDTASDDATDASTGSGACEPPNLICAGECIDPSTDRQHCGECGEDCGPGGTCVNGDCIDSCGDTCDDEREVCLSGTCLCRIGFTRCGDVCVDLETNPAFCGDCSESCLDDDEGEVLVCEAGDCYDGEIGCSAGLTQCGQSCVDLQTHPLHCDECGRACDGDEVCIDGDCEDL